jgi:hypothetical protein
MKNVEAAGILMLQECPNEKCSVAPWDVPINCLKATCEVDKGGCGEIFCFLCTALYRPYILHGNYYHRPQCTFYEPICCDQNQCIKNGKENCEVHVMHVLLQMMQMLALILIGLVAANVKKQIRLAFITAVNAKNSVRNVHRQAILVMKTDMMG